MATSVSVSTPDATAASRCPARIWRTLVAGLLTVAALAALFPNGSLALRIDSSPQAIGGGDAQSTSATVLAAIFVEGALSNANLAALAELEQRIRKVPGVVATLSAISSQVPLTNGDDISVASWMDRREDGSGLSDDELRRATLNEPLIMGRLISADQRAAAIQVDIEGPTDADRQATAQRVAQVFEDNQHPDMRWQITGAPLVAASIGDLLLRQLAVVLPLSLLVFAALVLLAFRRIWVVVASLFTVFGAVLWTLGLATALGWSLNLVTIIIPALVMCLTVAYGMHVISAYADAESLSQGLALVRGPLAFSAVTTAIGLGALAINDLESMRQFAALGAMSAAAAALAAWTLLPLLLGLSARVPSMWPSMKSLLMRWAHVVVDLVLRHSWRTIVLGVVALILCLIAALEVKPGARYVQDLPTDDPTRRAYEEISAAFGGANQFEIRLAGAAPEVMLAPTVLAAVEELQTWLMAQPEVGATLSPVDYIKRLHQAFGSGEADDYQLPATAALTKQLVFLGAPEELYRYADLDFSRMRIVVHTPEVDTPVLQSLFRRIEKRLTKLPEGLAAQTEGPAVELVQTMEQLTGGQLKSLAISAGAIFLLLSLLFASLRVGAMAMLPNALPVVAYFALLGLTGTPLSPTTALVSCIVLGIAVDDTLHMLVRFNRLARDLASEEEASRAAVAEVLRPITLTTAATCAGFLMLTASPFHSQQMFGLLAAITLLLAWFSDVLLAPAVSARSAIVTLWDVVRLDLGGDPQKTIPLFAEMSDRQARLFALNATVRKLPPNERLIVEGDPGGELYVVIDGTVRIWRQDEDGRAQVLAEHGRGSLLGEVGYFAQRRSANVSSVTPCQVMVLDAEVLERVRRRHPRIAALAYRNLNRIQAERALRSN